MPDIGAGGVCLYGGLPVLYLSLPVGIMGRCLGAAGSPTAMRWLCGSLALGWAYRMLERFCVDGHALLAHLNRRLSELERRLVKEYEEEEEEEEEENDDKKKEGKGALLLRSYRRKNRVMSYRAEAALLRATAALLSPTAVLHWATGVTLFAGFVHVRSVDAEILQME